ncbi:MAG: hypothetical protein LBE06_08190 [Azoarcus sp.]|nr:hypothetical protein [Azoarcus sp.]
MILALALAGVFRARRRRGGTSLQPRHGTHPAARADAAALARLPINQPLFVLARPASSCRFQWKSGRVPARRRIL